jgi:hypothetical protein
MVVRTHATWTGLIGGPIPRAAVVFGLAAALVACADGTLPPMAANDPANPRAPESPVWAPTTPPAIVAPEAAKSP